MPLALHTAIMHKARSFDVLAFWFSSSGLEALHACRFAPAVAAYYGEDGLQELLGRTDVQAVLLVVPPQGMMPVWLVVLTAATCELC